MNTEAARTLLESNLVLVDEVVKHAARRYQLSGTETDELRSEVYLRLMEKRGFEAFEGRSSLRTYLTAIVHNALLDLRNKSWQKWRPSVEARRLGSIAVKFEELHMRDGLTFEHAIELLRTNHGVSLGQSDFERIAERLPRRTQRRFVGTESIADLSDGDSPEEQLLETEQRCVAGRIAAALERALMQLESEDRLILKMHFYDGVSVADIARVLRLEQKRLYRRIEGLLGTLRAILAGAGFTANEVGRTLDTSADGIASPDLLPPASESPPARSSK